VTIKRLRDHFCTKKGPTCKRPGVVLLVSASKTTAVTAKLSRRPLRGAGAKKAFGTVRFNAGEKERRVTFNRNAQGRRLTPARYELRVGSTLVRFRVRPS
jgi:hypothetical protein